MRTRERSERRIAVMRNPLIVKNTSTPFFFFIALTRLVFLCTCEAALEPELEVEEHDRYHSEGAQPIELR